VDEVKFKVKKKIFLIDKMKFRSINKNYILTIKKSDFLIKKINNIQEQKSYLKKLRKDGNELLQITNGNTLVATTGLQFKKNKVYQGILIVNKNYVAKGLAKYFILMSIIKFKSMSSKNEFFAGVDLKNIASIKSYIGCGFKVFKKKKYSVILRINIKKSMPKLYKKIKIY
jgi:hypothetical protein